MAKKAIYKLFNGNSFEDIYFKTSIEQVEGLEDALSSVVVTPTWSQVTEKPTWIGSSKPTYNAGEVGARSSTWTPTWGQVSDRPSTMTSSTVVQASPENAGDSIRFINPWDLKQSIIDVNDTSGYIKSVSYADVGGPKPPVNATTNTGTVTNVSPGTQVNGLTLTVDTGSTTPVIKTSITNQAQFRTAIGAGTSSLTIGTEASNAKAGNYHPTWAQVTGKPTFHSVATSGSYNDLSNTPGVLSVADGSTGTGTGARFVSGYNLKAIIDNVIGNYKTETTDNKRTTIRTSGATNTAYVSELGVKNYVDGINTSLTTLINQGDSALALSKQDSLGFTPENAANKRTTVRTSGANNTAYVTEAGIKSYVESMIGSVYRPSGDWNASTNTPALTSSMPANLGKVYRVSVEGTRFGYTWNVGDKLTFIEGGAVTKWDNVDDVTSVAGRKGDVVLTKTDVGLSSVLDYGIASQTAAQDGTLNNVYMTPLRTKQAINNLGNVTYTMIGQGIETTPRLVSASDLAQGISNAVSGRVPTSRTINGKALTSNITLEAGDVGAAPSSHAHTIANVTGLQGTLNGKAATTHTHTIANVTGLQTALDGKSGTGHAHTIANVTGLQTALDGKSGTGHSHAGLVTTGAQSWAGVKTFTSIPVLPNSDPTSSNQAVRKKYVDDKVSGTMKQVSWNASTGTMIVEVL